MSKKIKSYIKCLSNTFFFVFPIIFAHVIYITTHTTSDLKSKNISYLDNNYNESHDNQYSNKSHVDQLSITVNEDNNRFSTYNETNRIKYSGFYNKTQPITIESINLFPSTIFKMIILVIIVALWKSNHLFKLFKTGVL